MSSQEEACENPMDHATRLRRYIRMIEDYLDGRMATGAFARTFFHTFHDDPGGWSQGIYDALNSVATACESYSPGRPKSEFDVSGAQLREECDQRLGELRRLARAI